MRSESEVKWVRARNNVAQRTVITDWHAIIPGLGSKISPPGTICNTGLTGSLQMVDNSAIRSLDGRQHEECVGYVNDWIAGLDPSPGPLTAADPEVLTKAPDTTWFEDRPEVKRLPGKPDA